MAWAAVRREAFSFDARGEQVNHQDEFGVWGAGHCLALRAFFFPFPPCPPRAPNRQTK
jgi:hypothetical protein